MKNNEKEFVIHNHDMHDGIHKLYFYNTKENAQKGKESFEAVENAETEEDAQIALETFFPAEEELEINIHLLDYDFQNHERVQNKNCEIIGSFNI